MPGLLGVQEEQRERVAAVSAEEERGGVQGVEALLK